jgi:hypothetical protein
LEKGAAREADGAVLLETDELVVRGEARVRIKRTAIQLVTRRAGSVTVTAPTIDMLDVKPEAAVLLIGTHDDELCAQLTERTSRLSRATSAKNRDVKAKELGLTATKVARVSDTLTAEKLVRPLASRGSRRAGKPNGARQSK